MVTKTLRDALQIIPLIMLLRLAQFIGFEQRRKVAGSWFKVVLFLSRKLKKRIDDNLSLIMPELKGTERNTFIRKFANFSGSTLIELIYNHEFQNLHKDFKYSKAELSPLLKAKKERRPIIIVSAHLGPWEAVRAVLKRNDLTSGAIYKKNKNRFYESIHLEAIKAGGEPIFSTGLSGTKKMIQYLKNGGVVAVMLDQADETGEYFDFLGVPAKTSTSMAKIALKLDALVVPAFAIRDEITNTINVSFEKPLESKNYYDLTLNITKSIESRVRKHPAQWHWLHRRWKY